MKIVSKLYMHMQFKDDKEFIEEVQKSSNSLTLVVHCAARLHKGPHPQGVPKGTLSGL